MRKLFIICLMLLGVAAKAQTFVIPTVTSIETARRAVNKGNSSNFVLVMYQDTLRLVGKTTVFNVSYGDAASIALNDFNITGVGVNVTGGTGNLSGNRSVQISLPQPISSESTPSFFGLNSNGNVNFTKNLSVGGTTTFDSLFAESRASSSNFSNLLLYNSGENASSKYIFKSQKNNGSLTTYYPLILKDGNVKVNSSNTTPATKAFEVSGDASISNKIFLPATANYPLNTFLKVVADGEVVGYDLNLLLDAKLNSSMAASTYLPLSNPIVDGSLSSTQIKIISNVNPLYESRLEQEDSRFSISNYYNGTGMMDAPDYLNVFTVVDDKVGINTNFPNAELHVVGGAKIENNLELNDIPDVRAAINAKLSSSTAASTYAPINNANFTGTTTTSIIVNTAGANFATSSGSVGIGNNSPSKQLDVTGEASFSNNALTGGIYIGPVGFQASIKYNANGNLDISARSGYDVNINGTGAVKIPVGTDAQRPASPVIGMLRVNTTASPAKLEYYNGSSWIQL